MNLRHYPLNLYDAAILYTMYTMKETLALQDIQKRVTMPWRSVYATLKLMGEYGLVHTHDTVGHDPQAGSWSLTLKGQMAMRDYLATRTHRLDVLSHWRHRRQRRRLLRKSLLCGIFVGSVVYTANTVVPADPSWIRNVVMGAGVVIAQLLFAWSWNNTVKKDQ